jgi:two-component system phosphate regulon response regulator PhoB
LLRSIFAELYSWITIPVKEGNYHIIAVDDEFDVRELLRYNLTRAGYYVSTFPDAASALKGARELKPDLILTDWLMPGMDGLEFCRTIKQIPEIKKIPVIMITCKGDDSDISKAARCGITDYFVKPFLIRELVERIEGILDQKSA